MRILNTDHISQCADVHVTDDDKIYVIELVIAVTNTARSNAYHVLRRIKEQFPSENYEHRKLQTFSMFETKLVSMTDSLILIPLLRGKCDTNKGDEISKVIRKYIDGDKTMVKEINEHDVPPPPPQPPQPQPRAATDPVPSRTKAELKGESWKKAAQEVNNYNCIVTDATMITKAYNDELRVRLALKREECDQETNHLKTKHQISMVHHRESTEAELDRLEKLHQHEVKVDEYRANKKRRVEPESSPIAEAEAVPVAAPVQPVPVPPVEPVPPVQPAPPVGPAVDVSSSYKTLVELSQMHPEMIAGINQGNLRKLLQVLGKQFSAQACLEKKAENGFNVNVYPITIDEAFQKAFKEERAKLMGTTNNTFINQFFAPVNRVNASQ